VILFCHHNFGTKISIQYHFKCTSSHLIYCISWARCGMLYIEEIGRSLRTRFGEHWLAVIGNDCSLLPDTPPVEISYDWRGQRE
jgi:hypothetical protein